MAVGRFVPGLDLEQYGYQANVNPTGLTVLCLAEFGRLANSYGYGTVEYRPKTTRPTWDTYFCDLSMIRMVHDWVQRLVCVA